MELGARERFAASLARTALLVQLEQIVCPECTLALVARAMRHGDGASLGTLLFVVLNPCTDTLVHCLARVARESAVVILEIFHFVIRHKHAAHVTPATGTSFEFR